MSLFASPASLKRHGVIGINRRNADVIMRYNPRRYFPLVDDKLATRELAIAAGVAVPELYGVIALQGQIRQLTTRLQQHEDFVVKPARGTGGNGILVITGRFGNHFRQASGNLISLAEVGHHISNILSGMYSLAGVQDKAIIEYRVQSHPAFNAISYRGVPDIRVIVFRGIPIAAMLRLPTRTSDGKANLHQGALGVGVDLTTGRCRGGVLRNRPQTIHPDTQEQTTNVEIPQWQEILTLAVRCADMVKLGYLGVDIVIDQTLGPLILELNARPGLNVQIANQLGLAQQISAVEALDAIPTEIEARLQWVKSSQAQIARH